MKRLSLILLAVAFLAGCRGFSVGVFPNPNLSFSNDRWRGGVTISKAEAGYLVEGELHSKKGKVPKVEFHQTRPAPDRIEFELMVTSE